MIDRPLEFVSSSPHRTKVTEVQLEKNSLVARLYFQVLNNLLSAFLPACSKVHFGVILQEVLTGDNYVSRWQLQRWSKRTFNIVLPIPGHSVSR